MVISSKCFCKLKALGAHHLLPTCRLQRPSSNQWTLFFTRTAARCHGPLGTDSNQTNKRATWGLKYPEFNGLLSLCVSPLYQEKAIRLGHNQKTTKQNREIRNHSMLLLQAVIDSLSPWRPPAPSSADQIQAVIATIAPPAPSIADQMPSISHNVPLGKNMHAV